MGVVYDKFAEKLAKKIGDKLPRATIRETQPRRILVADVRGDVHGDTEDWLISVTDFAEEHFKRRFASEDRLQTIRATVRTKEDGECETLTRLSVERDWFDDLDDPEEEERQERVSDEVETQDLIPITGEDGTTHWVTEHIAEKYMQMRRIRELELRTDKMQDQTLKRFTEMSTPTETAQKIATGMLAGAARFQDRAATAWEKELEKKYDTDHLEADMAKVATEEAGKKERQAARNKFWAPYGDAFLKQVGKEVKKRMNGKEGGVEGAVVEDEEETQEENAETAPLTDDEREQPIATLAQQLGRTLEPEQWFALFKTLETSSVEAFQNLVCAQNDDAAREAWAKVSDDVPTPELLKLHELLTPDQRAGLDTLGEAIGVE